MTLRFPAQAPRKKSLVPLKKFSPGVLTTALLRNFGKCQGMLLSKARFIGPLSAIGLGHAILGNFSTDKIVIELTKMAK